MKMATQYQHYCGRFAPSPTGPLHMGSLLCAVGSYLQARKCDGLWLVRIEDLDPPREQPGAGDAILRSLEAHGLLWDQSVSYQSGHSEYYEQALAQLITQGLAYACNCSRKTIREQQLRENTRVYPGICRDKNLTNRGNALRLLSCNRNMAFTDPVAGYFARNLALDVGDFVVKRRDGLYAYQLAVVVDDHRQGITEVVRGNDLLDNTPQQMYLQQCLALSTPDYVHLPILINEHGDKLSKQNLARPIDDKTPSRNLACVLQYLGHELPPSLQAAPVNEQLLWAVTHWQLDKIPRQARILYRQT